MNQRDKWLEERGLQAYKDKRLPYEEQPQAVRVALAMLDQGSPRAVVCSLNELEPDSWDLEMRVVESHVEHRIAVRLFSRFENGGDNRALELWREHVGRFKGDSRTNYDRRGLRDIFADNPLILQFLAWQEEQIARGNPMGDVGSSDGIPVDALQSADETDGEGESS